MSVSAECSWEGFFIGNCPIRSSKSCELCITRLKTRQDWKINNWMKRTFVIMSLTYRSFAPAPTEPSRSPRSPRKIQALPTSRSLSVFLALFPQCDRVLRRVLSLLRSRHHKICGRPITSHTIPIEAQAYCCSRSTTASRSKPWLVSAGMFFCRAVQATAIGHVDVV